MSAQGVIGVQPVLEAIILSRYHGTANPWTCAFIGYAIVYDKVRLLSHRYQELSLIHI